MKKGRVNTYEKESEIVVLKIVCARWRAILSSERSGPPASGKTRVNTHNNMRGIIVYNFSVRDAARQLLQKFWGSCFQGKRVTAYSNTCEILVHKLPLRGSVVLSSKLLGCLLGGKQCEHV